MFDRNLKPYLQIKSGCQYSRRKQTSAKDLLTSALNQKVFFIDIKTLLTD